MEFVIVTCDDEQRVVFIDNQEQGVTDVRLSVPEGLHVFDLGAPQNYEPPFQELLIENTTPTDPMQIPFFLAAARETVGKRRTRKPTAKRRKAKKSSAAKKRAKSASRTRKRAGTRKSTRKSTRTGPRKSTTRKSASRKRR